MHPAATAVVQPAVAVQGQHLRRRPAAVGRVAVEKHRVAQTEIKLVPGKVLHAGGKLGQPADKIVVVIVVSQQVMEMTAGTLAGQLLEPGDGRLHRLAAGGLGAPAEIENVAAQHERRVTTARRRIASG